MSLRVRLGIAAGVAVAIAVLAVAISAYAGTRSHLRGQVDHSLEQLAQPIVGHAKRPAPPSQTGSPSETQAQSGSHGEGEPSEAGGQKETAQAGTPGEGAEAQGGDCDLGLGLDLGGGPGFGGAAGLRQFVSRGGHSCKVGGGTPLPLTSKLKALAAKTRGSYFDDEDVSGHDLRVLAMGLPGRGALEVALPLTDVDHTLHSELLLLAVIAAAGVALAALLGILVARTALAPIARFTKQTESIAAGSKWLEHERLDVVGDDELARLARTFNATLDALEVSVRAQRNLVADASHELRTPIASLRANLQLLHDEALLSPEDREALRRDMIDELDELTALVGDVVELARGAKEAGEPGDVRLDAIVTEAVERARRRAPGLSFDCRLEPTLVRGEGDRIARAVSNLLDNAAKWSPPDQRVEINLHGGTLSVRDHGPGFDEEDLPYVFDRFHRARKARSKPGSGLGLAIVRQAAEAHGGSVQAGNAPDGGALLRISFGPPIPLEPQAAEPVSAS
jgi:two-component system sensor histidine kinase MprB